jgi:predicted nucleotidyltransferase
MAEGLHERLRNVLGSFPEVAAAYVFGSRAGDGKQARRTSDVDVAVIFDGATDGERRFLTRCILSERLAGVAHAASADVVDLETATPLLAHEVLRKGKLLLSRDEDRRIRVVARQAMRYMDSRPMRRTLDEATFRRLREGRLGRLA